MLYIVSHLGNTNQNTAKDHFILTRMVTVKKIITSPGKDMGKVESSYFAGGKTKCCSPFGRQSGNS